MNYFKINSAYTTTKTWMKTISLFAAIFLCNHYEKNWNLLVILLSGYISTANCLCVVCDSILRRTKYKNKIENKEEQFYAIEK